MAKSDKTKRVDEHPEALQDLSSRIHQIVSDALQDQELLSATDSRPLQLRYLQPQSPDTNPACPPLIIAGLDPDQLARLVATISRTHQGPLTYTQLHLDTVPTDNPQASDSLPISDLTLYHGKSVWRAYTPSYPITGVIVEPNQILVITLVTGTNCHNIQAASVNLPNGFDQSFGSDGLLIAKQ